MTVHLHLYARPGLTWDAPRFEESKHPRRHGRFTSKGATELAQHHSMRSTHHLGKVGEHLGHAEQLDPNDVRHVGHKQKAHEHQAAAERHHEAAHAFMQAVEHGRRGESSKAQGRHEYGLRAGKEATALSEIADRTQLRRVPGHGLHVIKNPAGTHSFVGTIPADLGSEVPATQSDVMGGRAHHNEKGELVSHKFPSFKTKEEAHAHAARHGWAVEEQ